MTHTLGITKIEGKMRMEFSIKRVVTLTLLFTNAYFLTLLFIRLITGG
jgi:hypothetical protein